MTQTPITVSVIMPLYNSSKYVSESIDSVLAQTYPYWELIVVDDCSKDNSYSIVKAYADKDSRIKLYQNQTNSGAAKTRNYAITLATGSYIALLDSDDLWHAEKLEKQLALARERDADIIYSSYGMFEDTRNVRWDDCVGPGGVTLEDMVKTNLIGCLTVMVKADLFKKYPFPLEYYHEDYANWVRLLMMGYKARGSREVLAFYRIHPSSRSANKLNAAKERFHIYRKLLKMSLPKSMIALTAYMLSGLKKYKKAGKKKLTIIGHFGGKEIFLDGQTIKTKILFEEFERRCEFALTKVDTYEKKHPMKLLLHSILSILKADAIIVMVHENGIKLYFPLLYLASKVLRKKVYHDVIGGDLPLFIKQHPIYVRYLNSFQSNWVETRKLYDAMVASGVNNCRILPNFKRVELVKEDDLVKKEKGEILNFCTFSRVIKEKGIEDAVSAVLKINEEAGCTRCQLTIYGQVGPEYKEEFEALQKTFTPAVAYGGLVPYDLSTDVLKSYDALLFPTSWVGECFPGTIVDAFSAGTPVLASDWNSNGEIITLGEDGLLYPSSYGQTLKELMEWAIDHPADLYEMSKHCLSKAATYGPEPNMKKILSFMKEKRK
ncbi:MAG: glycosyltransferase [Dorea sp.]|nr:glycosyltransferase [Dorea sp.]